MLGLQVLGRGLWWRRGSSLLVLLVAATTTGTATAAVLYRDAAAESALRSRLAGARVADTGVRVLAGAAVRSGSDEILQGTVPGLPKATGRVGRVSVTGSASSGASQYEQAQLLWVQDFCAHVTWRTGRCPTRVGEAAVSSAVTRRLRWRVGTPLTLNDLSASTTGYDANVAGDTTWERPPGDLSPPNPQVKLRVVGVYQVSDVTDSLWMGEPPNADGGDPGPPVPVVVGHDELGAMPHLVDAVVSLDQPLRVSAVRTADVGALRRGLAGITAASGERLTVVTGLGALLTADAADRRLLDTIVRVAAGQLLVLVGLVLAIVIALTVTSRRAELSFAALRGRRPLAVAAGLTVEPALLLAAGLVVGLAASPLAVRAATALWLRPDTPRPRLGPGAVVPALVVAVVGLLVSFGVALRAASRPAAGQLSGAPTPVAVGPSWWEATVVVLAVAGLSELLTAGGVRDTTTPWALVAPALCALAAALVLARLIPLLLGPAVRATADSGKVALFLAVRELRRDRAAWRTGALVAVAVALLSFAVSVNRGAAMDRADRAALTVGAPVVATVQPAAGRTLTGAVAAADPQGRWAMAAESVTPYGSDAERTLAVDSPRLGAVASWSRQVAGRDAGALGALLQPHPPTPAVFTGGSRAVDFTVDRLRSPVAVRLVLQVVEPGGHRQAVSGRLLRLGEQRYTWLTPACARPPGCRVLAFDVARPAGRPRGYDLSMRLRGLGSGPWSVEQATSQDSAAGLAVSATVADSGEQAPRIVRSEFPAPPPAVTAGGTGTDASGLDGERLGVTVAGRADALPQLLTEGALVDLSYARLAAGDANRGTTRIEQQVWVGPGAPGDALARLDAVGLHVTGVRRSAEELATLNHLAPAAGLNGYLAVGLLAVLVAIALQAANVGIAARRRRSEYVALVTTGVARTAIARALLAVAAVRLVVAGLVGLFSGVSIGHLAAPGVPLAAAGTVPVPHLSVPVLPALLVAGVALLPLVVVEFLGVRRAAGRRHAPVLAGVSP